MSSEALREIASKGQYQRSLIMTHFTEAILAASKARAAPWCWHHKQRATRLAAKIARPCGWGASGRRGRCGACPMAPHRAAHRAYPGDPIRSHEMGHYQ